ncbi:TPA: hypothetical protein ACIV9H_004803, partial [Salmonella enterica subsp. enterica serovar Saintpaul]
LSQGQYPMSLTSLDALLGGHNWLLKYRDKLPMTMTLLRKKNLIKQEGVIWFTKMNCGTVFFCVHR